jgi:hypothetical protein
LASLAERNTDSGEWYTATRETVAISAHRESDRGAAPYTLYWHGRTSLSELARFAAPYFSRDLFVQCDVLAYTHKRRIQRTGLRSPRFLRFQLPFQVRFIRIECLARSGAQRLPVMIIWSRLDLATLPVGTPVPDEIGVYLFPTLLPTVSKRLVDFIERTHTPSANSNDVVDCLGTLAERLRPASDHRPTYA